MKVLSIVISLTVVTYLSKRILSPLTENIIGNSLEEDFENASGWLVGCVFSQSLRLARAIPC